MSPTRFLWKKMSHFMRTIPQFLCVSLFVAVSFLTVHPASSLAQQDEQGQQNQQSESQLPELAPQEVEIRGNLDISFPSLERQPLTGFNPPPSTYEVPESRTPHVEEYKQEAANLPASPIDRQEPDPTYRSTDRIHTGSFEAGAGRYLSRLLSAKLLQTLSAERRLDVGLDYRGTNGHDPFPAAPRSSFDRFHGNITFRSTQGTFQPGIRAEGFYRNYALYGADGPDSTLIPQPDRRGTGVDVTGLMESTPTAAIPGSLAIGYSYNSFQTRTATDDVAPIFKQSENRVDLTGRISPELGSVTVTAGGTFSTGGLGSGSGLGNDYLSYDGEAGFEWTYDDLLDLKVGLHLLGFQSSAANSVRNASQRASYLYPEAKIVAYALPSVHIYAKSEPGIETPDLAGLFDDNPFLVPQPVVKPTIRTVDAEVGVNLYLGRFHVSVGVGESRFPIYRFYETSPRPPGGYDRGFLAARYAETRTRSIHGTAAFQLGTQLQTSAGVKLRSGVLTNSNQQIPYLAPVTGTVSLIYSFAQNKGRVKATGKFVGRRYTDRTNTTQVAEYLAIDSEVAYKVATPVTLFLRLQNASLSDVTRWNNYPTPTNVLVGGVRIFW